MDRHLYRVMYWHEHLGEWRGAGEPYMATMTEAQRAVKRLRQETLDCVSFRIIQEPLATITS